MIVEQVTMTPAMAKSLLAGNDKNRSVSDPRIAIMAAQMKAGKWQLNGQTIIMGETGRLLDGQHRLAAVVVSKTEVPMLIVRGAPEDSFSTIDTGRSRKASDIVAISGQRHANQASAGAAGFYKMMTKTLHTTSIPPQYLMEVIERFPSLDGWVDRYRHGRGVRSLIGSACMVMATTYLSDVAKRPELAASLFDGIDTGEQLFSGNPILALRNRLIRLKASKVTMNVPNTWPAMCRTIDALEGDDTAERVLATKSEATFRQPKRLASYWDGLTEAQWMADLPAPLPVGKVRNQSDIMARLVNK